jgi:hypothetical protein
LNVKVLANPLLGVELNHKAQFFLAHTLAAMNSPFLRSRLGRLSSVYKNTFLKPGKM